MAIAALEKQKNTDSGRVQAYEPPYGQALRRRGHYEAFQWLTESSIHVPEQGQMLTCNRLPTTMEEALGNSPANGAIRLPDDAEDHPVKTKTARILQSHKFHNTLFALIVVDCIIVITELCWKLLDDACSRRGEEHPPDWLQVSNLSVLGRRP